MKRSVLSQPTPHERATLTGPDVILMSPGQRTLPAAQPAHYVRLLWLFYGR